MALSEQEIAKAKDEARKYLEYSTYVVALSIGVDPLTLSDPYIVPVSSTHPNYQLHVSLGAQVSALENL